MSFYPQILCAPTPSVSAFQPLFRLLDDFEHCSRGSTPIRLPPSKGHSFVPKFDVRELKDVYELTGELPGIDQKNVEIEFTDHQTLRVRGRIERNSQSNGAQDGNLADTKSGNDANKTENINGTPPSQNATVEDADEYGNGSSDHEFASSKHDQPVQEPARQEKESEQPRYWVSECSVGEFARSFTFPVRVDQDAVTASMRNGVLNVVAPKVKQQDVRRIVIY